jgi:hypothetical protein
MTVRMRLSGDPEEIEVMVKVLAVVFQLDGSGHFFTNQGSAGVRCYLTAHISHEQPSETDQHR